LRIEKNRGGNSCLLVASRRAACRSTCVGGRHLFGRCERAARLLPALHPMLHRGCTLAGAESTMSSRSAACSAYGYLSTCGVPGESLEHNLLAQAVGDFTCCLLDQSPTLLSAWCGVVLGSSARRTILHALANREVLCQEVESGNQQAGASILGRQATDIVFTEQGLKRR
jgi:hypothetical protein